MTSDVTSDPNRLDGWHILTVSVEDYFQGRAFQDLIDQRHWPRFEGHVEHNTLAALDLLAKYGVQGTFFVGGWVAKNHPDLLREIGRRGHEIASAGFSRRTFRDSTRAGFADELQRSRDLLEAVTGQRIRGFRAADHRLCQEDLWGLRVLAENGYDYDSSLSPGLRSFSDQPWRRFLHRQCYNNLSIWEVPLSSMAILGVNVPIAGGNWFRQLPERLVEKAVEHWMRSYQAPFVMYFRVWDLDPKQPLITGASRLSRMRHYRNANQAPRLIESFLQKYQFSGIANYLQLVPEPASRRAHRAQHGPHTTLLTPVARGHRVPASVVIPCYNEESALPYLANTLTELRQHARYDFHFIFVDDGSRDRTVAVLRQCFGSSPDCTIVEHEKNKGVAAAILTGIQTSQTEIVCSMDCDCTYDPHELPNMIPLLTSGVDMVTASPYHPRGTVLRVPAWRLALSKTASGLYRLVLRQHLYTYTSCFRVYRRSAMADVSLRQPGFLGVAEMLGRLDLRGSRIAEYPATLQVRMLGHSKMRVIRTIVGHLSLMARFAIERFLKRPPPLNEAAFRSTAYASKGIDRE